MVRNTKPLSRTAAWALLAAAVVLEVVGTTVMTLTARSNGAKGYLVMMAAIAASYWLLAQAVRVIPLGISYALWEGLGLLLIVSIGVIGFGETLTWTKGCGLALALAGIVLISSAESSTSSTGNDEVFK